LQNELYNFISEDRDGHFCTPFFLSCSSYNDNEIFIESTTSAGGRLEQQDTRRRLVEQQENYVVFGNIKTTTQPTLSSSIDEEEDLHPCTILIKILSFGTSL
jgi:hypothetical protein